MMFFHVDAGKLQSVLDHIREGQTVEGKSLDQKADFLLGSGVESGWGKNVPDLEMREMEEMTKIGTGYFLTTPVFDLDSFARFLKQTNTFGVPVIAEVMILRTAGMGRFMNRHLKPGLVPEHLIEQLAKAPETLKASVDIFAELVDGLREICHGVHIITFGGEDQLQHYLNAAKIK
jgi:5,10-methylenetetrahydrofolate reductase